MGIRIAVWVFILSLLIVPLSGGSAPAGKRPFQMNDVFGLVYASDPQISPDGQRIVYARTFMDIMKDRRRSNLWIINRDGTGNRPLTTGNRNDGSARWSPDGTRIIYISADEGSAQIYVRWMDTGQTAKLTQLTQPFGDLSWSPDGRHIAYTGFDDHLQFYQVTRLYLMDRDGDNPRVLTAGLDRDVRLPVWSQDGRSICFQYDDQGMTKIARVTLSGTVTDLTNEVGGISVDRPYSEGSFSLSRNGFYAFTYSSADRLADVGVGTMAKPGARRITALNDDFLGHIDLAKPEEIWFESSLDHRQIQGWIVKPPGFEPSHKYPLILEIHGGPVLNYGPRFAADIQLYAAAGYIVLYTNPRGSDSYGEEFGNLIHRNYPGDDYYDLVSGVEAVISKGYVDPDNLFITGGSGGGILTAWTIGRTDRFRAAAVQKPIINWSSSVLTWDSGNFFYRYWFDGFPWDDAESYMKRSPLSLVGKVNTPTMVLNGEEDYRTPISESEQYYGALKLRKIDTVLVRIPGASHDIASRPSQLITKVAYILSWFENHHFQRPPATL